MFTDDDKNKINKNHIYFQKKLFDTANMKWQFRSLCCCSFQNALDEDDQIGKRKKILFVINPQRLISPRILYK